MTSRILFEDDIVDHGAHENDQLKSYEESMVKEEDQSDGDIYSSNESQDSSMDNATEMTRNKYSVILENVIILGSKVNKGNEISNEQDGNIFQDEVNTSHDDGNTSCDDGNTSQDEGNTSQDEGNTFQDEGNTFQDESNTSQDKGKISQDEVTEGNVNPVKESKPKGKRKLKSELELLLLDKKKDEEDLHREYDMLGDKNKVSRRYKLRKIEQTVSYKEPADIKLKECYRTDNETNLTCPGCKQVLENKKALLKHLRIHNKGATEYTCSLCSMKFDRKADLIAHKQKHSKESFLCQECKLAFSSYSDFLLHNYEHLNQPHFKCSECGLRYRKSVYKQHIMTHFDKKLKLNCDLCSFVANNLRHLQTHLNQHSNKFTCVECEKVSSNKYDFDYHMSMHTGVKKVQCLYCGACFLRKPSRDIHHRTHTGEKPFTCGICGHKTRQWTDYRRHKETHVTEKKYTCDYCGKKYLHKDYLVIHMRCHTKQSLYECTECNAKYPTLNGLKSHSMFKHMSERPVECTVCDKKFVNYNQYRKHCRAKYHLRNVYGNNISANTKE